MKFLGVSGVFDYAGLNRSSRYRACSCCLPHITRASASGLHLFGAEYPPHLSSVYASLSTSRYPAQDSRPSGSLLLSREALSSSASCRFIPAHRNALFAQFPTSLGQYRVNTAEGRSKKLLDCVWHQHSERMLRSGSSVRFLAHAKRCGRSWLGRRTACAVAHRGRISI